MTSLKYKNNQSVLVVIYAKITHRVLMLQRQDDSTFWQSVTGTLETNETPRERLSSVERGLNLKTFLR